MVTVGLFLFNDMELLDFAGPYEVFTCTSLEDDPHPFHVFSISEDGQAIRTVNGLQILPDFGFDNHPAIDILIIPGGVGTKAEMEKEDVLGWIAKNHENTKLTLSVCSGARLLGKLGLLDGLECTTHHEVMEDLRIIAPKTVILKDLRFTGGGRVHTSAGVSAGIDLSLHIVEKLLGPDAASSTKAYMEYEDWDKS